MRYRAGKKLRLKNNREISRMFDSGLRARDARITLIGSRRAEGDMPSRVAAAVSGRHGGAVVRNRIKRLCREAFRTSRDRLPSGWDFVMLPRVGVNMTLAELADSLAALTAK
ncbi:MAG: ribonuclease P protein component, partial [Phycisphaerae bacterium]|nr:ribonuclease P protein component [Phycisphaerae bacterium]